VSQVQTAADSWKYYGLPKGAQASSASAGAEPGKCVSGWPRRCSGPTSPPRSSLLISRAASRLVCATKDAPSGIRTRATTLKGWRPGPLVDGGGRRRIAAKPVYTGRLGPVAQLVEQGTFNPKVTGSIPVRPTFRTLRKPPAWRACRWAGSALVGRRPVVPGRVDLRRLAELERRDERGTGTLRCSRSRTTRRASQPHSARSGRCRSSIVPRSRVPRSENGMSVRCLRPNAKLTAWADAASASHPPSMQNAQIHKGRLTRAPE
jgi:hypothetical protein